jgi:GH24 family phage-related lysozyme (muramidase)
MADTNNSNIGKLLLTNDEAANGLNIHFNSFKIVNNSTSISLEHGYKDIVKYYDTNDKSLLRFDINSLNNNTDKSIILKGAPQDETFYKTNVNYKYIGKLDSDNMHKNYHYTSSNNNRNINDTQKIAMDVELTTPNYGIYRFQKIKIILSSNTPTPASPMINQRLSGDWLIIDIKFMYYDKALRQVVSLVKRELELSDDELANETELIRSSSNTGDRGSNPNPNESNTVATSTTSQTTTSSGVTVIGARDYKTSKLLPTNTWENIAANFIAHKEGFEPVAKWDINHYRAGYGSDKKLVNGSLIEVTKGMTFTQLEAIQTLAYEIKNIYGPKIANNIGQANWNKLNNNQKASLASLGYNVGTGFVKYPYGQVIQSGIHQGNYPQAATGILNGPKTAGGKYLAGLASRRQEEASLFLT